MIQITFIDHSGKETRLSVPEGTSIMQAAVQNGVEGVIGECGGSAMCATCHCHIEAGFAPKLAPIGDMEEAMLDCAASPLDDRSRLGCQIELTPELDGIVVYLPESQI
ncbi:2Fe-2S iron-sulfur cluster binding domain-containing protein [Rhodobacter sp. NTK016B]|uniref:2Fe-2S iron-sulfur cluster-binding protein n=1 Tax=Rhodobacter sp. NTK016B TaxID=2759676 RepID=UPI001A8E58C0|nr:2Fe-2S iron-sulfur cluster-binding protein [Rhodobacter sp. NTK016B]MBN8291175.1 2Fe-2S iron-sulfur cluster binding domain-containing protein [Rhodobacter sp. NTK016B]